MRVLGLEIVSSQPQSARRSNAWLTDDSLWSTAGQVSSSGVSVSADSAARASAVYSCVNIISQTIASLPLLLYRRLSSSSKERATTHPLFRVLNLLPNENLTRTEWMQTTMWHLLLRGNAFSEVLRDGNGFPRELRLIHPDSVVNVERTAEGVITYKIQEKFRTRVMNDNEIMHIRSNTNGGLLGHGPIETQRDTIGQSLALLDYGSKFFANGVKLSGILEHPQRLDEDTAKRIADSFRSAYGGPANSGKVAVLEEGMKFATISMTNSDAQFIESRKMSRSEIAGIFRVPPHMIGDLDRATFSNIEHQAIEFVVHCIRPWLVLLEQTIMRDLLLESEQETYFPEFLVDALLRGDMKTRYEAYNIGINAGFLKFNDVRDKENMNPLDWGDAGLVPLNMKVITSADDLKEPDSTPSDSTAQAASANSFDLSVTRTVNAFRGIIDAAFGHFVARETKAIQARAKKSDYDQALRDYYDGHSDMVHERLKPVVDSLVEQLRHVADIYDRPSCPLQPDFMARYVADYCTRRFNDIFATDLSVLDIKLTEELRSHPGKESQYLTKTVTENVLGVII